MISTRPGSDAHRVLALLAQYPDELDAEAIAAHLWPVPRLVEVPRDREGWRLRAEARAAHVRETSARASRLLHRLQQAGLVERRGPPRLAAGWLRVEAARGRDLALVWALLGHRGRIRPRHVALVEGVRKSPPSLRALVGERPSRATGEAYVELVTWGVVVPPAFRAATERGLALVGAC